MGGWEAAREAAPKGQHAVYHSLTHTVELFKGFSQGLGLPCISSQACLGNSWRPQSQSCMLAVKLEETLSIRGTLQPGTLESMSLASTLYNLRVTEKSKNMESKKWIKLQRHGAGELPQKLRALAALPERPDLILLPTSCSQVSETPGLGDAMLSSGFHGHQGNKWRTDLFAEKPT